MDQEEPWIEDGCNKHNSQEDDYGSDLFAESPNDEFQLTFDGGISITLKGIKSKYPIFLQSTGLALWKSSERLCSHLCAHPDIVRGKNVIELGAGLGLVGYVLKICLFCTRKSDISFFFSSLLFLVYRSLMKMRFFLL